MITVRQITWDFLKKIQGAKDSRGQGISAEAHKCRNRHRDAYSWEIHSRDISILNMHTSLYTLRGEI